MRIRSTSNRFVTLGQCYGAVFLHTGDPYTTDLKQYPIGDKWYYHRTEVDPFRVKKFWIKLEVPNGHRGIHFPHWLTVLVCCAVSGVPWLGYVPRRFSLSTLLVATTLVAVVLGLVVWLSR